MWYMLAIVGDSIHLFTILFIQQMTCRPTGRRPAGRRRPAGAGLAWQTLLKTFPKFKIELTKD